MKQFIYPYIFVKDSIESTNYYKEVLGGEVTYTMLGKDTPNCPEDQLETVMHLEYKLNDTFIYFSDDDIEDKGKIQLLLDYSNKEEMTTAYNNMKKESEVLQELGETFWGAIFGSIRDKFGITWQFHYSLQNEE